MIKKDFIISLTRNFRCINLINILIWLLQFDNVRVTGVKSVLCATSEDLFKIYKYASCKSMYTRITI